LPKTHPPAQSERPFDLNPQARCIVSIGRVARPLVFTRSVAAKAPEATAYANEEKVSEGRREDRR